MYNTPNTAPSCPCSLVFPDKGDNLQHKHNRIISPAWPLCPVIRRLYPHSILLFKDSSNPEVTGLNKCTGLVYPDNNPQFIRIYGGAGKVNNNLPAFVICFILKQHINLTTKTV